MRTQITITAASLIALNLVMSKVAAALLRRLSTWTRSERSSRQPYFHGGQR